MKKFYRIIILLIVFTFLSTYNPNKLDAVLKKKNTFFRIQNIIIVNNFLVQKSKVNEKLNQIYNKSIFSVRRKDIEKPLSTIDFLEKIEVKKKYPNTIIVKIFETKPIAILFKDKDKYLLDSSSNLIPITDNMSFTQLPSVFGKDAEKHFIYFFNQLENNKFPKKKIKKYYFFRIGRWDLELLNKKIIKFPEENTEAAIKKSIELLHRKDFEKYNIIDLRVDGKIIVE